MFYYIFWFLRIGQFCLDFFDFYFLIKEVKYFDIFKLIFCFEEVKYKRLCFKYIEIMEIKVDGYVRRVLKGKKRRFGFNNFDGFLYLRQIWII